MIVKMIKKYYLILLTLGIFFVGGLPQAQADPTEDFLESVARKFKAATTPRRKYDLISQPVNLGYLRSLPSFSQLSKKELRKNVSSDPIAYTDAAGIKKINCNKTTPFSLAVSLGRDDLVQEFMTVVPDVNHPELTGWGDRQPYTAAHMALDPRHPIASCDILLENRLRIIDLLGDAGVDFNAIVLHQIMGVYRNPPLVAGALSGRQLPIMPHLRARALLYGADPSKMGSIFNGWQLEIEHQVMNLALDYIQGAKDGAALRPVPEVMDALRLLATSKSLNLDERVPKISIRSAQVPKLAKQIKPRKARKLQRTKKALTSASHHDAVLEELGGEDKKLLDNNARKLLLACTKNKWGSFFFTCFDPFEKDF